MAIAPILLFLVWGAMAWSALGGGGTAVSIAGVALLAFFIIELRRIARFGMILLLVSLILVGIHFYHGSLDGALLEKAAGRAAFLAFFYISLFFLQSASVTSPLVRRSGEVLVTQPPGRRYLAITFGGTIFGLLMSLGSLTLLGTMIRQGVENSSNVKARDIRLRRMTMAMLRSFGTIPMWSPITVTMAIVLSSLPEVSWIQIFPYGAMLALVFLGVGWLMDRFDPSRKRQKPATGGEPLSELLPLVFLVILFPVIGWALSLVLGVTLLVALLLFLPFMSVVWIAIQQQGDGLWPRLSGMWKYLRADVLPAMPQMRTELAIFAGSASLGVLLVPLLNVEWFGAQISQIGMSSGLVLIAGMWIIILSAIIGISPLITVLVIIEVLPQLPGLEITPLAIAIMAVGAWSISVNISPFATPVRVTGQAVMRDPALVGLKWNFTYSLIIAALLSAALLMFG